MIVLENKILHCWASQAQPNLRAKSESQEINYPRLFINTGSLYLKQNGKVAPESYSDLSKKFNV
ncbi:hypothetical protein D6219_00640 [Coxiella burnetii]|nr:hypothetical protein D6219_00640 [Coxiella burnetii]PNT80561.1 hypothetical protein C2L92_03565 [Coxiella burnetii]PNT81806.1 hypothetical protein C2L91_03675 [Coxiella burnetii]PNT84637.1 hypothetical protein C2L90_03645 [Coxiella burnetii]PNT87069.1 hypothetical protein C2L93_00665 [Coxiella burnetii]